MFSLCFQNKEKDSPSKTLKEISTNHPRINRYAYLKSITLFLLKGFWIFLYSFKAK